MSGSYQPYRGNPYSYGQGPGHLFFPPVVPTVSPLDNPATPSLPSSSPLDNVSEGALATLLDPEGDSGGAPSPSVAHPNPSISAMFGSLATGLGMMTPMGALAAPMSLSARSALGMEPGFGVRGPAMEAISRGLADLTSRDMTSMGLANAPEATGAQVGGWGLDFGGGDKGGSDMGGSKGGVDVGVDAEGPSPSADKGGPGEAPGDKGGSEGENLAGGGLIELAGGGKIVRGLGGGLDDLIPTTIEGRRTARLSDGEFVIPADVVSMMGDGSSTAGSRRLYEMMKAVRQEKTGRPTQAGRLEVGDTLRRIFK